MKLIILSSGKGTRLLPLTANTPKSLIDLGNGKTLLETNIDNALESEVIDEITIVTGYCSEQVEAKIKKYQKSGVKIKTSYNPFYDVSNNLMTLWMVKHEMTDNFIITNGDNIFHPIVFKKLVENNSNGIFLTTSKKNSYRDDDMKVVIKNGYVEKVSKKIKNSEASAESVGLALISGERYREIFKSNLNELAHDSEYLNKFWLEVFNRTIEKMVQVIPFEIDGEKLWTEIDFHGDLNEVIKKLVLNKLQRLPLEKRQELYDKLKLLNGKLSEQHISKILDFLPENKEEVFDILNELNLTEKESEEIANVVSVYSSYKYK